MLRFLAVTLTLMPLIVHAADAPPDIDLDATLPAITGQPFQECTVPLPAPKAGETLPSCPPDKVKDQTLREVLLLVIMKGKPAPTVDAALAREQFLRALYGDKTIPALDDGQKHLIMDNIVQVLGSDPILLSDVVHLIDPTAKPGQLQ